VKGHFTSFLKAREKGYFDSCSRESQLIKAHTTGNDPIRTGLYSCGLLSFLTRNRNRFIVSYKLELSIAVIYYFKVFRFILNGKGFLTFYLVFLAFLVFCGFSPHET